MSESQEIEVEASAEPQAKSECDLDFIVCQIYHYLATCKAPYDDWREIKAVIEEGLGQRQGREQTPSDLKEADQTFKEGPMPEMTVLAPINKPPRSPELIPLLEAVVDDPGKWLSTPNSQFGGKRPGELIGTDEETKLLDLLHAVDQGLF